MSDKLTAKVEADSDGSYRLVLYWGEKLVAKSRNSLDPTRLEEFKKSAELINAAALAPLPRKAEP